MKKLLFLLLWALMCTACSSSHRLAGEAPSKQDPTVEGGMNNESQHTKFSSYSVWTRTIRQTIPTYMLISVLMSVVHGAVPPL